MRKLLAVFGAVLLAVAGVRLLGAAEDKPQGQASESKDSADFKAPTPNTPDEPLAAKLSPRLFHRRRACV